VNFPLFKKNISAIVISNIGKNEVRILIFIRTKKENHMLRIMTVILNLGIVIYLGFQAKSCLVTEQIAGLNVAQDPLILSFVGVVALFIALSN
jgi:hypothetical protein